mgnify:CR=1 FL=1
MKQKKRAIVIMILICIGAVVICFGLNKVGSIDDLQIEDERETQFVQEVCDISDDNTHSRWTEEEWEDIYKREYGEIEE